MLNCAPIALREVAVAFEVGRLGVSFPAGWRVQRGHVDGGPTELICDAGPEAPVVVTVVGSEGDDTDDRVANLAEFEAAVLEGLPRADVIAAVQYSEAVSGRSCPDF